VVVVGVPRSGTPISHGSGLAQGSDRVTQRRARRSGPKGPKSARPARANPLLALVFRPQSPLFFRCARILDFLAGDEDHNEDTKGTKKSRKRIRRAAPGASGRCAGLTLSLPSSLRTTTSQLLVFWTRFWLAADHKSLTSKAQRGNTVPQFDVRCWAFDVRRSFWLRPTAAPSSSCLRGEYRPTNQLADTLGLGWRGTRGPHIMVALHCLPSTNGWSRAEDQAHRS